MPAQTKPVTISPAAAAAAGCTAVCEFKFTVDNPGAQLAKGDQYQFVATEAGNWVFDHWEWYMRSYYVPEIYPEERWKVGPISQKVYPSVLNPQLADFDSSDWVYYKQPGWEDFDYYGEIVDIVAVFRSAIVQRPFLVYADQAGKLVRTDAGKLMNGM